MIPHCSSWKSFGRSNDLPIKLWWSHLCSIESAFSSSNAFSSSVNSNTEAHCAQLMCSMAIFPVKDTKNYLRAHFPLVLSSVYSMDTLSVTTQLFKTKCSPSYCTVRIYKHRDDPPSLQLKCNKYHQWAGTWLHL